jgi:branched-chain amino acid transport system permease protein
MGEDLKQKFGFFILICISALILAVIPLILPEYYTGLVIRALILTILAMSVNLLLGHLGLASVGHSVFFGIASYIVAIVTVRLGTAFWPAMGLAFLGALIASGFFGLLAIRTKDIFFLTIMLAFCQVFYGISVSWKAVTGGYDGLPGLLRPQVVPGWNLESTINFYFFVLIGFLVVMGGFWILTNSPFGLTLKGIRDSESRMKVLGYNVWLYKYLAFNISALIGSFAGILHAYYDGCPNPADFGIVRSSTALFMVILGGPGTLAGPVVGSLVIVFLQDLISNITDRWLMVLGVVYVVVVLLFPEGILGGIKKRIEAFVGIKQKV